MSLLWGRFSWLRASLIELMGEGRTVTVVVIDGPSLNLPSGWQSWEAWLTDTPNEFLTSLLTNCPKIGDVVRAIKGIQKDLEHGAGSEALRLNCRVYFGSWLKESWVKKIEEGEHFYGTAPDGGYPPVGVEWVLTTNAAPVAKVGELVLMGKEIVLDEERARERAQHAFACLDDEDLTSPAQPRSVGRRPLNEEPRWQPVIVQAISMKESGRTYADIASELNVKYADLGPFDAERVRGLLRRELPRQEKQRAD
jgi:hypothetical protein